jgi:hypothetical protein
MNEDSYKEIPFSMVVFNENSLQQVFLGQPYSFSLEETHKVYFICNPSEDVLLISKSDDDIDLYLGDELYEDLKDFEMSFTNWKLNTIKITNHELK